MSARRTGTGIAAAVALAPAMAVAGMAAGAEGVAGSVADRARRILGAAGVTGGLVVHVGCGEGKLTAALGADDRYVVHGLDTEATSVDAARAHVRGLGLYGRVSVDRFDGRSLPFVSGLVRLVVAERLGRVPMAEVMRVLCPGGVAQVSDGGGWQRKVKPRPPGMDEWTHYLHDPRGTMTGGDEIVSLPRRTRWLAGPKWLRNHDFMSSLSGMVSGGGRIFYVIDEGLRNHIYLPARWAVIARDAFSGCRLWRRPIERWFPHTWPFKSGPAHLPRRIVTDGERVYVTLGITAPVSVLDAAGGKTIRTLEQTKGTEEIVLAGGVLYLLVDPDKKPMAYKHASDSRGKERDRANEAFGWSSASGKRQIMAVSAEEGKTLWTRADRVGPLTLAVGGRSVYYYDGEHVVALDRGSGKRRWASDAVGQTKAPATGYAPRLIVADGVVVLSLKGGRGGRLAGVSADDGKILWRSDQPKSGHFSPEDLFLVDGLLWSAATGKVQKQGTHFVAVDAKTGRKEHDFVAEQIHAFFMHQRCYPGRATRRYILAAGTGTEFLDLATKKCDIHHWLRGSCLYGLMPCNGLLYKPPDSCACYYQSKLPHFYALAPRTPGEGQPTPAGERLEKGPAYGRTGPRGGAEKGTGTLAAPPSRRPSDDWPVYRHDSARSGATSMEVSAELKPAWRAEVGGRLSTMTAAGGRLFVASVDRHSVHAISAHAGREIWSYTAGGRVDSPPTIHAGLALFGCADGWVYCLTAAEGKLVWRFRAAPGPDKIASYQQIESAWPLHGSVLVRQGVAYCLAGRNAFLDGGMRLVRLDCASGKLLSETVLNDKDPATGKNLQTLIAVKAMPVANADLLSCDGKYVYMAGQRFDLAGRRVQLAPEAGKERDQKGEGRHLFCPTGFLDEAWFHRSYWIYGKNAGEGHGEYTAPRSRTPCGRIMVFDQANAYALIAQNVGNNINPRTSYTLYAAAKDQALTDSPADRAAKRRGRKPGRKAAGRKTPRKPAAGGGAPAGAAAPRRRQGGIGHLWEVADFGVHANAMVLAGGKLLLAGAPDVADETKTRGYVYGADGEINRQMRRQEAAWLGRQGAVLCVVSAKTGQKLAERPLDAIPVWDGMIAAGGRIYLALKDGTVLCLTGR